MPVVQSYSEASFRDYLFGVLDEVGGLLGWTSGSVAVQEALNDALLEYGTSDITTILGGTNLRHLRAFGRRAIWRAVVQATAGRYDFRDSDATFNRSQIQEQAREALKLAESDALAWDPSYSVSIVRVTRPQDPYQVIPDESRVP